MIRRLQASWALLQLICKGYQYLWLVLPHQVLPSIEEHFSARVLLIFPFFQSAHEVFCPRNTLFYRAKTASHFCCLTRRICSLVANFLRLGQRLISHLLSIVLMRDIKCSIPVCLILIQWSASLAHLLAIACS